MSTPRFVAAIAVTGALAGVTLATAGTGSSAGNKRPSVTVTRSSGAVTSNRPYPSRAVNGAVLWAIK
jgi:hypothetical protein